MSSSVTHTSRVRPDKKSGLILPAVLAALVLLLALPATASAATYTQTFTNTEGAQIPDAANLSGNPAGWGVTTLSLPVSELTGPVVDVNVGIRGLSHTFMADLEFTLVGPTGQTVTLFSGVGGSGNALNTDMTFDDDAETLVSSLTSANAPFAGTFQPMASLAGFNGLDPNGTWQLVVNDMYSYDTGTLAGGWTLEFTVDEAAPTISVAGNTAAWKRKPVTLRFKAAATSGIARVEYRLGAGAWTELAEKKDGGYKLTISKAGRTVVGYRATSVVGTRSAVGRCTVKIDGSAPTLRLGSRTLNVWMKGRDAQRIKLRWNDADGGATARLGACLTQYGSSKQDTFSCTLKKRGKWQTVALPWRPKTPGRYWLHLTLTDEAGRSCKATLVIRAHR